MPKASSKKIVGLRAIAVPKELAAVGGLGSLRGEKMAQGQKKTQLRRRGGGPREGKPSFGVFGRGGGAGGRVSLTWRRKGETWRDSVNQRVKEARVLPSLWTVPSGGVEDSFVEGTRCREKGGLKTRIQGDTQEIQEAAG